MAVEPENTLRSFHRAQADGVDEIELDLHLSRDGHLVIMHDLDVARTTNGSGPIAELTLAELKELDAGDGERIPTFEEVLDVVDVPIQAEVKAPDAARATVETIRERGLVDKVSVTSFSADVVRLAKELEPKVTTGLIMSGVPKDCIERAKTVNADLLCVGIGPLTEEVVAAAHGEGLLVMAWPVNTPEQLLQAFRLGVDGITSDYPDVRRRLAEAIPDIRTLLDHLETILADSSRPA
ncbi:MAG TPA: glycerophosphodiester phosphodiesterase family protein [Actinopolymorphaceae bacterium]